MPIANSGEVREGYIRSSEKVVNVHLERKTVLPIELENKLVEYCVIMNRSYHGLRDVRT